MEWQISVWLEFAQEEACIRVKKKKKIKPGRVDQKKRKKKKLFKFFKLVRVIMFHQEKKNAFHCYFVENSRSTLENVSIPVSLRAVFLPGEKPV